MEALEIKEGLNEIFRDVLNNESLEIHETMTANDVDGWDSLNHVTLIVAIEKKMRIKFTAKEINSLQNVGDLITLIQKKII